MVQGSKPSGNEIFCIHLDQPWGPELLYTAQTVSELYQSHGNIQWNYAVAFILRSTSVIKLYQGLFL